MAYPQGINFRGTLAFVTDGSDEFAQFNLSVANYPVTTTQGNTVGFETSISGGTLDRVNTNDRRLAGIVYTNTTAEKFRFDLPATGSYDIRVAAGDAGGNNSVFIELFDTTTSLGQLVPTHTAIGSQNFYDATNTLLTNSTWPGSNAAVTKTFSTTICRFVNGDGTNICVMAHLHVAASSGGAASLGPFYISKLDGLGGGGFFRGNRLQ